MCTPRTVQFYYYNSGADNSVKTNSDMFLKFWIKSIELIPDSIHFQLFKIWCQRGIFWKKMLQIFVWDLQRPLAVAKVHSFRVMVLEYAVYMVDVLLLMKISRWSMLDLEFCQWLVHLGHNYFIFSFIICQP